jgi:hypothetical protein
MSTDCFSYWEPCSSVFEAFLSEMPARIQDKIRDRLRALAEVQAENGDIHASHFARVVSGEELAVPKQDKRRAHLRLVK